MDIYKEIFEFASSAGALEGYVYPKEKLFASDLDNWIKNLVKQYHHLPLQARESFQNSLDRTIGRAVLSLIPLMGEDHDQIHALKTLMTGKMPNSPNDFEKEKKKKSEKYGG